MFKNKIKVFFYQDYRDEMADKESVKMELVNQGQQLAKVSSEVRAADIEGKLLRLEDKWQHVTSVMSFRYVVLNRRQTSEVIGQMATCHLLCLSDMLF